MLSENETQGGTGAVCNVADGCNGVAFYCYNDNQPTPPADSSGGGQAWDSQDGGDYNYWINVANPCPGARPLGGDPPTCEFYDYPGTPQNASFQRCVGTGYVPEGGFDYVKGLCTMECEMRNQGFGIRCDDANWTDVRTQSGWDPSKQKNCNTKSNGVPDEYGHDIDWSLVGGSSSPDPTSCALDGDCVDDFFANISPWILPTGAPAAPIDPESRRAQYLGVDDTGSEVALDMKGSGDDTQPIHGIAEYTAAECGDDVCPFYLANLSAYNTTDAWHINVPTVIGTVEKDITNVQIDLIESTLGVLNTNVDYVAFAPGTLRFRVEFEVTRGCPSCSTYGDGTHAYLVENQQYAFAAWDGGAGTLELVHTFDLPEGHTGTLDIAIVPSEQPPQAAHDLHATEECDDINGLVLDETRSISTDPDDDIDVEFWWVNGSPVENGTVLPFGSSYQLELEVRDERGATDRTDPKWVYVSVGRTCSL